MAVAEGSLRPAEEALQGLQGRYQRVPEDRQLPESSRIQIPEQAPDRRHAVFSKAEGVKIIIIMIIMFMIIIFSIKSARSMSYDSEYNIINNLPFRLFWNKC